MMLSCEEASRLTSESLDHRLRWRERCALLFHLAVCKVCKTYARQIQEIRNLVKDLGRTAAILMPEERTRGDWKERIKIRLREYFS